MVSALDPRPRDPGKGATAALMLATGQGIRATARALGLSERTVRRWSKAPSFRARVDQLRAEMHAEAVGKLASLAGRSVDVLAELMKASDSPTIRLTAARAVLDKLTMMSEFFDLSERVRQLEQQQQNPEAHPWQR